MNFRLLSFYIFTLEEKEKTALCKAVFFICPAASYFRIHYRRR
ncbi:hypothetical protein EVA_12030 [gut metagenome]|uniref:Uncharacterized protein n=1 Tax=gut metagenome TaxID=749906 RepID=J9GJS4_9ZZZZ